MPRFVTIGYGDETGYARTPPDVRQAAHANDAELVRGGALVGTTEAPVQVRNPEGAGVQVTPGAFLSSSLPLAGFAVIEAADIDEAVAMVANSPCAVAHGVIEIWPLKTPG